MNIPIFGDIVREVGNTVREFIPDADKRAEIEYKFAELADRADARETDLLQGQLEINKEEAKHSNIFVAGWRPFIGWTSGVALAYTWIAAPFLQWFMQFFFDKLIGLPALSPESIFPIVLAMLGIAGMRTYEKKEGIATSMGGKVLKTEVSTKSTNTSTKPSWLEE